jgi:restriction system protein
MKSYYRILLGKGHQYVDQCLRDGFVGADYKIAQDLSPNLPDDWRTFNKAFIPVYLAAHPDKTRVSAGIGCGALWTLAKGVLQGDLVLSPNGSGVYHVGEVCGPYQYAAGQILPHRRQVRWRDRHIDRTAMSDALKRSSGGPLTIVNVSGHAEEIERLVGGVATPQADPTIEDPVAFALEKHLEDFLVQNWAKTQLGKDYDIFVEDGEIVGQQYETDTGPIDILAQRKDKKELLVLELKRGRASDVVVGQVLRYMGYAQEELAEEGQAVRGVIIALEDDQRLRRALAAVPNIDFFRYLVSFTLQKA